ncbi:putative F-box/LRR-repeat protein At3g28410 [Vitis riparia]|uniref:putative F-box/LRR-repeat protein At3g28410 n=1 Tax=Vitis riparia TaxID=96939 RepID=UPI00155AE7A0|nr:putative F-box/LRR-repeat protein At3g28410 [Vitis riparia]
MEDAVATSLLSSKWRDLWRLTSNEDFNYRWVQVRRKEIHPSVNHFVCSHHGKEIKCFSVSLRCKKSILPDVQSWITYAAKKNVEELCINLNDREDNRKNRTYHLHHLSFPACVLSFSSLVKLANPQVSMAGYGLLPSLINGITEKSPAVQLLCLINCNLTENLHVNISSNSNLRKLIIEDEFVEYSRMQHIFIYAPKITRIEFLSSMPKRKYHIVNMGVGIEARFNLNRMFRERGAAKATCNGVLVRRYQQKLLGLLKTFQTAKVLEVCSWCIQVLSILKVRQLEILLFEATHLVLNTGLNGWELPGIALLLRACRKLENLVIVMNDEAEELQFNDAFQRIYAFKQEFYWKNQGASSTVCLQQLAVVEFRISHGDEFFRVTDN